ncbi:MAG: bifunctional 5,10-methylene-tetrahydrofolate dehydrogenase/5,10-methylene-tetrahydrofolate cyclohydrolase [Clostridiales bacterium]|nr:bifunctional 5,10-methylene-tetrahydrofolate dehydrogenase/5,10-methylene-tetrahydrofolate cyclohydrolase [Clostridiales bacterium]
MTQLLKGKAVADNLTAMTSEKVKALKARGIVPTLAIVRLGENPGDISYEKGARKRAAETGIQVKQFIYDVNRSQEKLVLAIERINADESIHGVLIFRPLPGHIDEQLICDTLAPSKDMDGITAGSMAGVFMGTDQGFPPCTAEACIELLDYYGIELSGKKVTVIGRSLVIGKPVAMMAMKRNATVTMLHSRTTKEDFAAAGSNADIVIAALGKAKMVKASMLGRGQTIIDVGINVDEDGKLCGDVDFDEVTAVAIDGAANGAVVGNATDGAADGHPAHGAADGHPAAITPVPGGVGSVTTAVLMKHVAEAAGR